ncbi:MAG: aminopeptidase, partial [Pseudomonadota bacterium]
TLSPRTRWNATDGPDADDQFDSECIQHRSIRQICTLPRRLLAHQIVYVKGNATFNESFARAVEIEGTLRWLAWRSDPAGLAHYRAALARAETFFRAVKTVRSELAALYASPLPDSPKRRRKQEILNAMRELQRQRKAQDPAWAAYDAWFADGLNNARLASVSVYFDDVEMFRGLFAQSGGDFRVFYSAVRTRAALLERGRRRPA